MLSIEQIIPPLLSDTLESAGSAEDWDYFCACDGVIEVIERHLMNISVDLTVG